MRKSFKDLYPCLCVFPGKLNLRSLSYPCLEAGILSLSKRVMGSRTCLPKAWSLGLEKCVEMAASMNLT